MPRKQAVSLVLSIMDGQYDLHPNLVLVTSNSECENYRRDFVAKSRDHVMYIELLLNVNCYVLIVDIFFIYQLSHVENRVGKTSTTGGVLVVIFSYNNG